MDQNVVREYILDDDAIVNGKSISRQTEDIPSSYENGHSKYIAQIKILCTYNFKLCAKVYPSSDLFHSIRRREWPQISDYTRCYDYVAGQPRVPEMIYVKTNPDDGL